MWWAFLPALAWLAWHWFTTRDWRASVVWVAMAAGWLVWFPDLKRTMFLFYMTPLVPFLIFALVLALGTMLGPGLDDAALSAAFRRPWRLVGLGRFRPQAGTPQEHAQVKVERRRNIGLAVIALYLGLVIVDFAWMWPLFTGELLTYNNWHAHMWFASWV